jgi:hypothetical protein
MNSRSLHGVDTDEGSATTPISIPGVTLPLQQLLSREGPLARFEPGGQAFPFSLTTQRGDPAALSGGGQGEPEPSAGTELSPDSAARDTATGCLPKHFVSVLRSEQLMLSNGRLGKFPVVPSPCGQVNSLSQSGCLNQACWAAGGCGEESAFHPVLLLFVQK